MIRMLVGVIVLVAVLSVVTSDVVVNLPEGQVRGLLFLSNFSSYYGFRGIPFAKPPIGNLRFEAPQPSEPWEGVLDATNEKPSCVTLYYNENWENESEDCLHVNVYTPTLEQDANLPVIVWIYGGGFRLGNSTKELYGPDFLLTENIIFVSFNYRLGPFGFLSTGDEQIPGNNGLKDQNLALQWTKTNIKYFGGDPDKVTIFGQSAGAASVGLHVISEKSAGLFRAAIMNSGSSLSYWTVQDNPAYLFNEYVSLLPEYNNSLGAKAALQALSVEDLINASNSLPLTASGLDFVPVLEVPNKEAFLTQSHYQLLESGNYTKVPILIGVNSEEALTLLTNSTVRYIAMIYDSQPENLIPLNLNVTNQDETIDEIKNLYLAENSTFLSNLSAVVKYAGDNVIIRPCLKEAHLHSLYSPVYLYDFTYEGNRHHSSPIHIDGTGGAAHADDITYIFYSPKYAYSTNATDLLMQNKMVAMWTNFAKNLNPTPEETDLLDNTIWEAYSAESPYYLKIDTTVELKTHLRADMMQRWDDIFEVHGVKPFTTY